MPVDFEYNYLFPLVAIGLCLLAMQVACLLLLINRKNGLPRDDSHRVSRSQNGRSLSASPSGADYLRATLDRLDTQVCVLNRTGQILDANAAWLDFDANAGPEAVAKPGASFIEFCHSASVYGQDGSVAVADAAIKVARGKLEDFEAEYPALVGGVDCTLHVRIKPIALSGDAAAIIIQSDRTEARNAEQLIIDEKQRALTLASALETSQESLELAVKGGNLGLWYWDVKSGYFELSSDWLANLGHDYTNLNADVETFRDLLHPEERVFWTEEDAASLATDEPYDRQFRIRRANGSYTWVQVLGRSNALLDDGSPESLSGTLIDIDARKNAELRDAGMAQIIEESLNEIYVFDLENWRYLEVNRGARENLGYSLDDLQEATPLTILPEYSEAQFYEMVSELTRDGKERVEFESIHTRKDGSTYPVMVSLQRSQLVSRDVFVAFAVDLTQRHSLEAQLQQAQKLESIGQLAAGVAHEMNTPLQYVNANIKYIDGCAEKIFKVLEAYEKSFGTESELHALPERKKAVDVVIQKTGFSRLREEVPKAISDSIEGIERVLHIVRAMKEFSHPGEQAKTFTDLNRSLTSTATITKNRWKYSAKLELQLDPTLKHVECDPGPINQVFVNLIVNAADAIADRIESDSEYATGKIIVRTIQDNDSVIIEVEDDGCGMSEEVSRRVFDPFYTTKEVGRGTGQGLSLSHSIITQQHGGSIDIESRLGLGTTFRISLPVVSDKPEASNKKNTLIVS